MEEMLRDKLSKSDLGPTFLSLVDESDGCGSKFACVIVSSKFEGMPIIDRQRAVNDIISVEMQQIHAFSMKTWTPTQYEKKKSSLA
mmetsp:Transcript_34011/g.56317  ORF Transcript_34011/g.56317 Transcript_34011/m.56317 type:complete len:86 (-) Transcript_34011:237-494(-)